MKHTLLDRYGLNKLPFGKDIDPHDFFDSSQVTRAVDRLKATVQARSSAVLTGDPGTGKTFVLRALEDRLQTHRIRFTYIHNSQVSHRDFYRQLSAALGLETRATPAALFRSVSRHLEETALESKLHPVIVFDEAQLLSKTIFETLPLLLNFHRDSKPFLSIILVGLPELRQQLRRQVLSSLAARLPVRIPLEALEIEEVGQYLAHHMRLAGCEREVFAEDAVLLMREATGGVLRKLNVLALGALEAACEGRSTIIDANAVERALESCVEALV